MHAAAFNHYIGVARLSVAGGCLSLMTLLCKQSPSLGPDQRSQSSLELKQKLDRWIEPKQSSENELLIKFEIVTSILSVSEGGFDSGFIHGSSIKSGVVPQMR